MNKKLFLVIFIGFLVIPSSLAYYTAWRVAFLSCKGNECDFKYNFDIQEDYKSVKTYMDECSKGCTLEENQVQCKYDNAVVKYRESIFEINLDHSIPETIARCIDKQNVRNKACNSETISADFLIFSTRLCDSIMPISKCDNSYWYTPRFDIIKSKKFTPSYNFTYYDDNKKIDTVVYYDILPLNLPCGKGSRIVSNDTSHLENFLFIYSKENKWMVDNYIYITKIINEENAKESSTISESLQFLREFIGKSFISKIILVPKFFKQKEKLADIFFQNIERGLKLKSFDIRNSLIQENRKLGFYEVNIPINIDYKIQEVGWVQQGVLLGVTEQRINCGDFCNTLGSYTLYVSNRFKSELQENIETNKNNEDKIAQLIKYYESEESYVALLVASWLATLSFLVSLVSLFVSFKNKYNYSFRKIINFFKKEKKD